MGHSAKHGHKHQILVVDDDQEVLLITRMALKRLRRRIGNLEVFTASSGEEAVAIMTRQPDVAVVLMDQVMESDYAGLEACRQIREVLNNRQTRILLRTGRPGLDRREMDAVEDYDLQGHIAKGDAALADLLEPVAKAFEAYQKLKSAKKPIAKRKRRHRVLVVDDDAEIRTITRIGLKRLGKKYPGLRLLLASSGREALEMVRVHPSISVMLIDEIMESDYAGLDTCRKIREELGNHSLRILMRTGKLGIDRREEKAFEELDVEGHLPKGEIPLADLIAAVDRALESFEERAARARAESSGNSLRTA